MPDKTLPKGSSVVLSRFLICKTFLGESAFLGDNGLLVEEIVGATLRCLLASVTAFGFSDALRFFVVLFD